MTPPPASGPSSSASPEVSVLRAELGRHRAALLERLGAGEDGTALGRENASFSTIPPGPLSRRGQGGTSHDGWGGARRGRELRAGSRRARSDADVVVLVRERSAAGRRRPSRRASSTRCGTPPPGRTPGPEHRRCAHAGPDRPSDRDGAARPPRSPGTQRSSGISSRGRTTGSSEQELGGFIERLEAEAAARHERFGGSVYLLEPDVKSGAGGPARFDGVRWAARARYRVGGERRRGAARHLGRARSSRRPRCRARRARSRPPRSSSGACAIDCMRARPASDRLGFEEQEALAVAMGYGDDGRARRTADAGLLPPCANRDARTREPVERLKPPAPAAKGLAADLGGGVHLFDGHVTIAGSAELQGDPALAMRAYSRA